MNSSTNFATGTAQGAAVAHTYQVGAIYSTLLPLSGREIPTFFTKKEQSWEIFLSLLCLLHISLTGGFKQKTSLATYECSFRKGELHIASDMWKTALRVAFLFNNLVKL